MLNDLSAFQKIVAAAKYLGGEKVILFGSSQKGVGNDIDLCILVGDQKDSLEYQKQLRLKLWQENYSWERPLDLHVYPKKIFEKRILQGDPFAKEINKGIILYG